MRWRLGRRSSNIEDRRSQGGGRRMRVPVRLPFPGGGGRRSAGRMGGLGLGGILIILVLSLVFGVDPSFLLGGGGTTVTVPGTASGPPAPGADEELKEFTARVLGDTEDTWHRLFEGLGGTYQEPSLVLFSGAVQSACGFQQAAVGPFYCPGDQMVYLDLDFFRELQARYAAPGDFARAYVIAHEVGHHVQNLIGVLAEFNRRRSGLPEEEANALSVRVELQADCFAGVWGARSENRGLLEEGDLDEALNAAAQIGDDTIQRRTQGYVVPETFNHGTAEQRRTWFMRGFESGDMNSCDTFQAGI